MPGATCDFGQRKCGRCDGRLVLYPCFQCPEGRAAATHKESKQGEKDAEGDSYQGVEHPPDKKHDSH